MKTFNPASVAITRAKRSIESISTVHQLYFWDRCHHALVRTICQYARVASADARHALIAHMSPYLQLRVINVIRRTHT